MVCVLYTVLFLNFLLILCCFVLAYFIENQMILTSSSRIHSPVSHESTQSRPHRPTQNPSPTPVPPNLINIESLQNNTSLVNTNRELALRQLTEQLWAAGLPSSTTGCSMSVCSGCSSAPPSERGGEDEPTKTDLNNDNEEEENIDWDEPNAPDDGNNSCLKFLLFLMLALLVRICAHIF